MLKIFSTLYPHCREEQGLSCHHLQEQKTSSAPCLLSYPRVFLTHTQVLTWVRILGGTHIQKKWQSKLEKCARAPRKYLFSRRWRCHIVTLEVLGQNLSSGHTVGLYLCGGWVTAVHNSVCILSRDNSLEVKINCQWVSGIWYTFLKAEQGLLWYFSLQHE